MNNITIPITDLMKMLGSKLEMAGKAAPTRAQVREQEELDEKISNELKSLQEKNTRMAGRRVKFFYELMTAGSSDGMDAPYIILYAVFNHHKYPLPPAMEENAQDLFRMMYFEKLIVKFI